METKKNYRVRIVSAPTPSDIGRISECRDFEHAKSIKRSNAAFGDLGVIEEQTVTYSDWTEADTNEYYALTGNRESRLAQLNLLHAQGARIVIIEYRNASSQTLQPSRERGVWEFQRDGERVGSGWLAATPEDIRAIIGEK